MVHTRDATQPRMVGRSLLSLNPSLAICLANGKAARLTVYHGQFHGPVTLSKPTMAIGGWLPIGLGSGSFALPLWVRIRLWRGPFVSYTTPPRSSLARGSWLKLRIPPWEATRHAPRIWAGQARAASGSRAVDQAEQLYTQARFPME